MGIPDGIKVQRRLIPDQTVKIVLQGLMHQGAEGVGGQPVPLGEVDLFRLGDFEDVLEIKLPGALHRQLQGGGGEDKVLRKPRRPRRRGDHRGGASPPLQPAVRPGEGYRPVIAEEEGLGGPQQLFIDGRGRRGK